MPKRNPLLEKGVRISPQRQQAQQPEHQAESHANSAVAATAFAPDEPVDPVFVDVNNNNANVNVGLNFVTQADPEDNDNEEEEDKKEEEDNETEDNQPQQHDNNVNINQESNVTAAPASSSVNNNNNIVMASNQPQPPNLAAHNYDTVIPDIITQSLQSINVSSLRNIHEKTNTITTLSSTPLRNWE